MRSLVYFVAVTLDGRIAGPDGGFDFFPFSAEYAQQMVADWSDGLPTGLHRAFGVTPPRTRWDTVVMGRGTFQPAIDQGVGDPYEHLRTIVYSSTLDPAAHPLVEVVADDATAHVRALKAESGADIWLCGGGRLAAALADEVDRLVVKINPVTVGSGIGLFEQAFGPRQWKLTAHRVYDGGVMVAEYEPV